MDIEARKLAPPPGDLAGALRELPRTEAFEELASVVG